MTNPQNYQDVDGRLTVTDNQGNTASADIVDGRDLDGDGTLDEFRIDTDGDGRADGSFIDQDNDGRMESISLDTDGDGVADRTFQGDDTVDSSTGSTAPVADTPPTPSDSSPGTGPHAAPEIPTDGTEVDLDGDGFGDAIIHDTDGDGQLDIMQADTDGDGVTDLAMFDTDGDGVVNDIHHDSDGDGIADQILLDTDGDGQLDQEHFDTDGDGIGDTYATDTDGDGVYDQFEDVTTESEAPMMPGAEDADFDAGGTELA